MIKKILLIIALFFSISSLNISFAQDCKYSEWWDIKTMITWCKAKTLVWTTSNDFNIDENSWQSWLKTLILEWLKNISTIILVLAILSLVYAWILLQLAWWEDEKVNKAKWLIKWVIIWTLLMISASWIIALIITVIFWLAWK